MNTNKSKLAFILYGIHYYEQFNHWMGWKVNIDFRKSIDNYKSYIYSFFEKYDIDTFISTYKSNYVNELLETYQPKNYLLNEFIKTKNHIEQKNDRLLESLDMCLSYEKYNNIKYKYYIITRFDLFFINTFDKLNIVKNKINLTYKTGCGKNKDLVDDNLYILTEGNLDQFIAICKKIPKHIWFHELHKYIEKLDINFMIDGTYYSHESPLYRFVR